MKTHKSTRRAIPHFEKSTYAAKCFTYVTGYPYEESATETRFFRFFFSVFRAQKQAFYFKSTASENRRFRWNHVRAEKRIAHSYKPRLTV